MKDVSATWDRRIARALMRPLAGTALAPNHVTAVSLLLGLGAGLLYARGGAAAHWGGAAFLLALLADHADGELARMSGRTSVFGHYFDYLAGGVTHVALFVGMGIGLGESALGAWAPLMGIAAGVAVGFTFSVRIEIERWLGAEATALPSGGGFEVEDLMYLVGPVTWLGGAAPFLAAASVGAPLFLIWQVWAILRALRRGRAP